MGLMSWLRGGGRTETGTGAETATAAEAPHAARRERVDPAELPPIQRVLGSQDLVIDPTGFQGSLSTRQDTALGTPLGHLVSPDAPTGLVHGITDPAPVDRTPPVQRSAERTVDMPVRGRALPLSATAVGSVPVQRGTGGVPVMTSAGESAGVAELPVRHLVGEQTFVPASVPQQEQEQQQQPPAATAPSTPASFDVQRAVTPPASERARRMPGLGAPLPALPPTAQRQAASAVPKTLTEPAAGGDPAGWGAEDGGADGTPGASESTEAQEAAVAPEPFPAEDVPTAPLLGDDPLLPPSSEPASTHPSADSSMSAPSSASSSGAPAVQRTGPAPIPAPPATHAAAPVVPLLADRPLTLQSTESHGTGEAAGTAADVQRSAVGHGPEPDAVPVRWVSAAGAPSATAAPPAPWALQRTVAPSGEGPGGLPAPPPALQRQAVGGPPVPRSLSGSGSRTPPSVSSVPSAPGVPSYATAGSVAVAAGVAQRMADGSVVFGSPSPAHASPVVQREEQTEEPPPPEPPPQEPGAEPEPDPGPAAEDHGPAAAAPGGPPGQGGGPGGGAAPVVTDELVRALYPPLSRLFKADLRLERERAGFLINTRH
ncbi:MULTISPECIES: hypothetical protein [unclassified Streptomyces]|uniref:hypothetical protein n=1 Tax=unclassified Streptomyces TaxID=2593676 RepID=UPI0036DFCE91